MPVLPTPDEELTVRIRNAIQRYMDSGDTWKMGEWVSRLCALPVYGGIGAVLLVAADGTVYAFSNMEDGPPVVENDLGWQVVARVNAAKKYPELIALVPSRPPGISACARCNGDGVVRFRKHDFGCGGCHGLGWWDEDQPKGSQSGDSTPKQ